DAWRQFFRVEALCQFRRAVLILNRTGCYVGEFSVRLAEGISKRLRVSVQRIQETGDHAGYVGMVEDVTRSRELEEEHDELRRFAECSAAATDDIVHIYDIASKTTVYVNHASESFFGLSCQQIRELGAGALTALIDSRDFADIQAVQSQYATM